MDGVAFAGIFLGCLFRTFFPYLKKMQQAKRVREQFEFDLAYLFSFMASILLSAGVAMMVLPSFEIPEENVFSVAFVFGWFANDIFNRMIS